MPYSARDNRVEQGLCLYCPNPHAPGKRTCQQHLDKAKSRLRERREQGLCQSCDEPRDGESVYCAPHRERHNAHTRKNNEKTRATILEAYGGKCVCCGESVPEFLSLDHVNNDGAEHRRQLKGSANLYRWAIRNGFPNTLQLLCFNCNCAKGLYGVCPHQLGKAA